MSSIIAVSQQIISKRGSEIYESLDANWNYFMNSIGFNVLPISFAIDNIESFIEEFSVSGFVLSGGGDIGSKLLGSSKIIYEVDEDRDMFNNIRDSFEEKIVDCSKKKDIPLIGVCRGMQFLNVLHNGNIEKIEGHRSKHSIEKITNDTCFSFDQEVNSYHNWGINKNKLGDTFDVLAMSGNYAEAMWSKKNKQLGIMWHPERNSPFSEHDKKLFLEFFNGEYFG